MVATAESPNGVARGYLPAARPRWRWVEPEAPGDEDPGGDDPGREPFRAEIRTNLLFDEIDRLSEAETVGDVWERLAPYVRAWNLLGTDAATGEAAPVPPPAASGPDAFKLLDTQLAIALWNEVRFAHLGGPERGKGRGRRASTPAPGNSDD